MFLKRDKRNAINEGSAARPSQVFVDYTTMDALTIRNETTIPFPLATIITPAVNWHSTAMEKKYSRRDCLIKEATALPVLNLSNAWGLFLLPDG